MLDRLVLVWIHFDQLVLNVPDLDCGQGEVSQILWDVSEQIPKPLCLTFHDIPSPCKL